MRNVNRIPVRRRRRCRGALLLVALALSLVQGGAEALEWQPPRAVLGPVREAQNAHGFPEEEVGTTAYLRTPAPIDLDDVRGMFQSVEAETEDYILGVIEHPNPHYYGRETARAYVHRSGWILAGHRKNDHRGRLIDWLQVREWNNRELVTKLEVILNTMADDLEVPPENRGITFYDFSTPNATHMRFVWRIQYDSAPASMTVRLPNGLDYYHRSWSASLLTADFLLNGRRLENGAQSYDTFLPSEFPEEQPHVFELICISSNCWTIDLGGFVLTYGVQRNPSLEPVMTSAPPAIVFDYPDLFCEGALAPAIGDLAITKAAPFTAEVQWTTDSLTTGEVEVIARAGEGPVTVQDPYYGHTHTLRVPGITLCNASFTARSTDRCAQVRSESLPFDVCPTTLHLPLAGKDEPW